MNGAVASVLNRVLGDWIENLNSDNLNLSIFSGQILLQDLNLKSSAFNNLGLPFNLEFGFVGKISANIPWSSLSTSPLRVLIENVHVFLTPLKTENWSPENELERRVNQKLVTLKQVEALKNSEVESKSPGFVDKLVAKIVHNLQIEVRNVYVRYTDEFSSTQPFAFGIALGGLKAVTCNSIWNEEFVQDSTLLFKLAQISDMRIFLDYGPLQNLSANELVAQEFTESPKHFFILPSTTFRLEATVNKDQTDYSLPQLRLSFTITDFNLNIDTIQIKHILKTVNYMNLFSVFQKGVFEMNPEEDFAPEETEQYRMLFIQSKTTKNKQKLDSVVRELEAFERNKKYEALAQQRALANKEFELAKLEAATKEEIESASAAPSRLSRLSGFFSRAPAENEEAKKEKIKKLMEKLNEISENKEKIKNEVESFIGKEEAKVDFPDNYVQKQLRFTIEKVKIRIVEGENELLEFGIVEPSIDVELANKYFNVYAGINSFSLVDLQDQGQFTQIVKSGSYSIAVNNKSVLSIEMKSGDLEIYIKIKSILSTINALKEPFVNDFEYSYYTQNAQDKTKQYITAGEQYLAKVMKTGINVSLKLDIDLKAPTIILPLVSEDPTQGLLVIDFGNIKVTNAANKLSSYIYDAYNFKLVNFEIWTDYEYPVNRKAKRLLDPVSLELALFNLLGESHEQQVTEASIKFIRNEAVPNIIVNLSLHKINFNLKDSDLFLLMGLKQMIIKQLESIPKPPKLNKDLIKLNEKIEVSIIFQFNFHLHSVNLNLISKNTCFTTAEISDLVLETLIVNPKDLEAKFYLAYVEVRDNREGVVMNKVVCNPALVTADEDEFTDALEELKQLSGEFVFDGTTSLVLSMNDLRIIASPDYVAEILVFSKGLLNETNEEIMRDKQLRVENVAKVSDLASASLKLKINLSNVTLLIPLDVRKNSQRVGSFNLSVDLTYNLNKVAVDNIYTEYDEVSVLNVKKITSIIGLFNNNSVKSTNQKTKNLLEPTQFFLRYLKKLNEEPSIKLSLDSTSIDFGFRDADFFQKLLNAWSGLTLPNTPTKKPVQPREQQKLSFEVCLSEISLQITNDTSSTPESILIFGVSQSTLRGSIEGTLRDLEFRSKIEARCYNEREPEDLIEPWEFYIQTKTNPKTAALETLLSSDVALNINISENMIKKLVQLKKKFKENPQIWAEEVKDDKTAEQVTITNLLGEDIIVSVPDAPAQIVSKGQKFILKSKSETSGFQSHFILEVNNNDQIYIDVSLVSKEFNIKRSGNFIGCLLKVKENTEENEMVLETQTVLYNITDKALEFSVDNQKLQLNPNEKLSIPISFCGQDIKVLTDSGPTVLSTSFCLGSSFVSVEKLSLKDKQNYIYLYFVFVPSFYIQNLLPCALMVLHNPLTSLRCSLQPGETKPLPINPKSLGKMQVTAYLAEISPSSWFEIGSTLTKVKLPANNLRVTLESTEFDIFSLFQGLVPVSRNINCRLFQIYSRYIFINKTVSTVEIKKNLQIEPKTVGLIRCKRDKIRVKTLVDGKFTGTSKEINAKTVGITGCISLDNPRSKNLEILYGVQILQAPLPLVKSKVIILTPRFVIYNLLGRPLFIRQVFDKKFGEHIFKASEEFSHFQLENAYDSRLIQVSTNNKHWSISFSIEEINDFQISLETLPSERTNSGPWYLPGLTNDNKFYLNVSVVSNDQACINLSFKYPKEPEFLIKNNTEFPITLSRPNYSYVLPPFIQFPWADSSHVTVRVGKIEMNYNLLKVEKKEKQINNIKAEVRISGVTRIFEFGEYKVEKLDSESKTLKKTQKFEVSLGIGISLFSDKSVEMFFLSVGKVYFCTVIKTRDEFTKLSVDLRVSNLQLDNMQKEETHFGVVLAGLNDSETPFFQAKAQKNWNDSYSRFPWIEVIFQEIQIQLNLEVIYKIIDILNKYKDLLIQEQQFKIKENGSINENFPDLSPELKQEQDSIKVSDKVYVNLLRLYALKLVISFKVPPKKMDLKLNPLQGFGLGSSAKSLLSSFANITDSTISFTEIIVTDSFQFPSKIVETISQNYKSQGIRQVYRLLGSSDMLGNPLRLMGKLGTGVFEFISEPMKGLLQGPKSLPGGVKKGVKSLVSNIVGGGMHTISTITGNLYNVVNKVKGSEEKDLSHEKIKGSIVGGLKDIGKGVSGIFSKPWEGLKSGGGAGLVKGIGSGLLGAVSTPLSVGLRITSGISSEVTGAVSVKRPELIRIRLPKEIRKHR